MPHRSVSQLTSWDRCSWAYWLGRREKKPSAPAAWTIQGNAFHDAAEMYELSGRLMPIPEAQNLYFSSYDERIEQAKEHEPNLGKWLRGGRTTTEKDIEKRRALGAEQVENYIYYAAQEGTRPVYVDGKPLVEVPFELDAGEFVILGYIDVVLEDSAGTLVIRDLKTGNEPDFPVQLYTYGYGFEEKYGTVVWWGDYYLAKQDRASKPKDLKQVSKETILKWFVDMDAEENAGHYRPRPGDSCFACDMKHVCEFAA